MSPVHSFTVLPALPEPLKDLEYVAKNMFWSWNPESEDLFKRIDGALWEACGHNPVRLLGKTPQQRLEVLAKKPGFLSELKRAVERLDDYMARPTWFDRVTSYEHKPIIAYFCAEFGLHESLPIYAGGLGILAGDHLKSASDLGIPLVGVGLLYQRGYFRQYLNVDGWQQEVYADNEFHGMPMELVRNESGCPLTISVDYPGRPVTAQIWRVSVGRIALYLLDTNTPDNSPADKMITSSLYGGDRELRIRQEIMLGIGGFKALLAMNIEPAVCHMNEGHAAFMGLERIRHLRTKYNMTFDEALQATRTANVFTVHTLVKAGLDEFRTQLMDKYFGSYFPELGISRTQFMSLGRMLPDDDNEAYKMPILAINLSSHINGVSRLHGQISRELWASLWPRVPIKEVPIRSITNGVHTTTWLAPEVASLYKRYLGPSWVEEPTDPSVWKDIDQIPDEQIWQVHQRCKEELIVFTRNRLKAQMKRRGTYHSELNYAEEVLDPETLTIGFARRFASYKRGNLLLRDPERLMRLLSNTDRPMQIIFAGKAHPRDTEGKEIIRQIVHFANQHNARRRIVFIEDYDMHVAKLLVRGVDVWLNTPRRPMEASGTSGMKAALNGVLNMSTADGWWPEGYQQDGGWVIGAEETYEDPDYQDKVEAQSMYDILENEVVPLFYTRSADNIPRAWISRIRASVRFIAPRFNTHRMVGQYMRRFYNPAATRWQSLSADGMKGAREYTRWRKEIQQAWGDFSIQDVLLDIGNGHGRAPLNPKQPQLTVGSQINVNALVRLGRATPADVTVQMYHGEVDAWGNIREGKTVPMEPTGKTEEDGRHWFTGSMRCKDTGQHGVAVRVLPRHGDMASPHDMNLILWEADK